MDCSKLAGEGKEKEKEAEYVLSIIT